MSAIPEIVMTVVGGIGAFQETLKDLESEWAPDAIPLTIAMSDLGTVFVEKAPDLSIVQIAQVFERLEEMLHLCSEAEKDAVATGFLEAMASALDRYHDRKWMLKYAGKETRQYLKEWDKFCGL